MAATVIFDLDEISIPTLNDSLFTITAINGKTRQDYYKAVVSVLNQKTEIHGSQTLEVAYQSKAIANNEVYLRVKYKGKSIET